MNKELLLKYFLDNKYTKWYLNIVKRIQSERPSKEIAKELVGYVESHHIIPKSIDKSLDREDLNLVHCSAREHFVLHKLLIKMTEGTQYHKKMLYAIAIFRYDRYKKRLLNSKDYEFARTCYIEVNSGEGNSMKNSETKAKMSKTRKSKIASGEIQIEFTEERRKNLSIGQKKRRALGIGSNSDAMKKGIAEGRITYNRTKEQNEYLSKVRKEGLAEGRIIPNGRKAVIGYTKSGSFYQEYVSRACAAKEYSLKNYNVISKCILTNKPAGLYHNNKSNIEEEIFWLDKNKVTQKENKDD